MENNIIYLTVQHPNFLTDENKKDIERLSRTCPVAKLLNNLPIIKFIQNETPTEILVDDTRKSRCCGN